MLACIQYNGELKCGAAVCIFCFYDFFSRSLSLSLFLFRNVIVVAAKFIFIAFIVAIVVPRSIQIIDSRYVVLERVSKKR